MIVKMKKVQILALEQDRVSTLSAIRDLGVMHVVSERLAESKERIKLQARQQDAMRLKSYFSGIKKHVKSIVPIEGFSGAQFIAQGNKLLDELNDINKNIELTVRRIELLAKWGDFDLEELETFARQGYYIYPCEGTKEEYARCCEIKGVSVELLSTSRGKYSFVVVALISLSDADLPLANLPSETSLSRLSNDLESLRNEQYEIEMKLHELTGSESELNDYVKVLNSEIGFLTVRDGMDKQEQLVIMKGFVPERDCEALIRAANLNGWAITVDDPSDDDIVPTLLDVKKPASPIMPLFDFLGVAPGYHEFDVSGVVMIFFTIFFGMIIGDAGYGTIFLLISLAILLKKRNDAAIVKVMRLMIILSSSAIVWGVLSGNLFGCAVPGLDIFSTAPNKDANVQALCFILAICQLSLARLMQCFAYRNWRRVLGNIGWMLLLWGNFLLVLRLIVYPGDFFTSMYYFYCVGLSMILIFDVNWKDIGAVFNLPFSLIGTFVDILSYIRLFAVGISGYYIAMSFNSIGLNMWDSSLWIFAPLVFLLGHALNISLCLMGVLVHGVRLNTLEFANHTGLSWSGIDFKPFKK